MIVGVLVVIGIGITFAYFTSRVTSSGTTSGTTGTTVTVEDTIVEVEGNLTFDDLDIYPGHKNISSITVTATGDMEVYYHLLWTGINSLNTPLNYYVYKSTTNESPSISCSKQREVVDGSYHYYEECTETNFTNLGEVVSRGQISSTTESIAVQLLKNESLQATSEGAIVYYYVVLEYPNEEENQNIDIGGSFDGEVSIEFLSEPELLASEKIESLYEDNQDILAYDGTEDNNLRYIGADPANYVYFNCSDYSNPSSDTCELWRIIGVFDENTHGVSGEKLVKLVRNESIGNYAWDNKPRGIGSSTSSDGSNAWSDARLMMLLNPGYEEPNGDVYAYEGSLYYNARSGTCYSGSNGATVPCDFTTTGLKNDTTRNMIETVTWKLGATSSIDNTASEYYIAERGTTVYSGRPTEWEGKIALMYPSDYGYATDGGNTGRDTCLSYDIADDWYEYDDCYNNDWLYTGSNQRTLTPYSGSSVYSVTPRGDVGIYYPRYDYDARPSIYLNTNIAISGGTGTSTNPYTLLNAGQ